MVLSYTLLEKIYLKIKTYIAGQKKKKRSTFIYFNTNYRTEMKLARIIMDYSLLQFDALQFFLRGQSTWGGVST